MDILQIEPSRQAPALSATSDMPAHLQTPEAKAALKTDKPAYLREATPAAKPADKPAEKPTPVVAAAEPAEPDDDDAAQASVDAALLELNTPAVPSAEFKDPRPMRRDFDDPDGFDRAVDTWNARLATASARTEIEREKTAARKNAATATIATKFQERVATAAEKHPDLVAVVSASEVPTSPEVRNAIMTLPGGPLVAYHLAKNPDEAARIFALPLVRQVAEIGKLEAKFNHGAGETRPRASARPSAARKSAPETDPNKMNGDQYFDWKMAQKKKSA